MELDGGAFESFKTEYGFPLDPEQSEACRTIDGKILLLAVPGSGKTTVMISRLGYMTHVLEKDPRSILAITYSVAGTKEMSLRYRRAFGQCDIEFRTINGLCAAMIHRYEKVLGRNAFELIEKDSDVSAILRSIMIEKGAFPTENDLRDIKTAITRAKNSMLTNDEIMNTVRVDCGDFPEIYREYESFKRKHRLMDYDDQLIYGYKILKNHPEVNAVYADRFKYVCVDEAQDTSKLQHAIIDLIAKKNGNLFMVGDEDQSIYGFRAAYPKALLDFKTTYPDAKVLTIGNNYRSDAAIVRAADRFIRLNTERFDSGKSMSTKNGEGIPPKRIKLSDLKLLPDYIRRVTTEKTDGSTAALFRLNESMLPIIDLLSQKRIPFRVRGADGLFFTSSVVTDIINILKFASNPYDSELLRKIYYKLPIGLTKLDIERAIIHNSGPDMLPYPDYLSSAVWLPERKRARAQKMWGEILKINASDTYEAIRSIFFSLGYNSKHSDRMSEITKRNTLLSIADRHRERNDFYNRLSELEEAVKRGAVSDNGIILSTIHSAKGMEFDRVILCDCTDGILPTFKDGKSLSDEEKAAREEDRRLFYVGITRARKILELISWESEFGARCGGWEFIDCLFNQKKTKKQTK